MHPTPPSPRRTRLLVRAAIAACVLIWGTTWAAIRVGLSGVPPLTGAALRFTIAGTLLAVIAVARRVPLGRDRRERWLWLANGVLSFSLSYGVVYWSEQWVPSGLGAVIFATFPLLVAALAHAMLPEERLGAVSLAGIVIGFAGIAVIFSEDLTLLGGEGTPRAALVMLCSPAVSAVSSVVTKKWGHDAHPLSLASVPMLIGAALLHTGAALVEAERPVAWTGPAIGALLYLALAGSAVTFLIYFWLLARMEATRVALIAYAAPVVAVVVGVAVMGEPVTARSLLGSAVVVLGVVLASRPPRREPA